MNESFLAKEMMPVSLQQGGNSDLAGIKGEINARLAAPSLSQPAQVEQSMLTSVDPGQRRISPYEVGGQGGKSTGSYSLTTDTAPRSATSVANQLPAFLFGGKTNAKEGLLLDIRSDAPPQETGSEGDGELDSAVSDYRDAQRESTGYALVSVLMQTAMSSFKRLTQGQ